MASIESPNGDVRHVKNLGWLLRHWKEIVRFDWITNPNAYRWPDGTLSAYLRDGDVYRIEWGSGTVCQRWLNRPIFRGLPIDWDGRRHIIQKGCRWWLTKRCPEHL